MRVELPRRGRSWPTIRGEMQQLAANDVRWREGRSAVYVFHPGEDVLEVVKDAYTSFMSENGLAPGAFPSLARMEREVIDMALGLLHAPEEAAGSMTSGGTESILLAVKAARDWARQEGRGGPVPEIVAPYSAHPAFDKAADLLDMRVIRVALTDDLVADPAAMADAVGPNTVMLVGSAPCFPFGLVDPIAELGEIASSQALWLHVDACVGAYLMPFAIMNGTQVPPFDFAVAGVRSVSGDLHKYGYAAKGASTILFREARDHALAGFSADVWPCGRMSTPTLAGTRPGGAIAAAWGVMQHLGEAGYRDRVRLIDGARQQLLDGAADLGFHVWGAPQLSIVALGHREVDVLAVGAGLYEAGYISSRTHTPPGIHLMLSPKHHETMPAFVEELANCVERARRGELKAPAQVTYSG